MLEALGLAADGPVIPTFGTTSTCVKNNETFCTDWLKTNWSSVLKPALIQHIELTLIALAIGFVIAFALAVIAHRQRWVAAPVTFLGSLLYTIPSLAAFEILLPITGINRLTVEIPLVSYTLLILFTNTLAGLSGVSPEVLDAARGAGLTKNQILQKVELPLALPTIVAGVRVTIVTLVSLVTVAAFVLPQGLGKPIFDALNKGDFKTESISAGTLCILLALAGDALLAGSQRVLTPWASAGGGGDPMSNNFIKAFTFISDRHSLLLDSLESHLEVSAKSVGIAIVIGVPLGIFLGHLHRFSFLAINVSNVGRALPTLGVLALLLPVFGVGQTNVIIALVILAAPPILTNTYVAVDQVDADTVDAAKGIGLRPWQVITKVELPPALPLIFAGIRTATVFVIATATIGGVFGGGGLGDIISNEASYHLDGVIGACYVLIALAFISQGLFLLLERLVTPAGMRLGSGSRRRRFGSSTQAQTIVAAGGDEALDSTQDNQNSTEGDVDTSPQLEKGRST